MLFRDWSDAQAYALTVHLGARQWAWLNAADCPGGDCGVDQDSILIECALGARWGFYKFPPDPADDDPVGGQRLIWREVDQAVPVVGRFDREWLGTDPARVALGFDLALPLREQLKDAKRQWQILRRQRMRAGQLDSLAEPACRERLATMLRLLDADAAGADETAMTSIDVDWRDRLQLARALCAGGYRRLARLSD